MSRHDMAGVKTSHDWCHDIDGRLLHWRVWSGCCDIGGVPPTPWPGLMSCTLNQYHRLPLYPNWPTRSVSEYCEHYTPFLVQAGCRNVTRQVL
ncbi:hypothetical protein Goklo_023927 [Gossypium klotzschianum]|uniref:Uncharacterized protein n=1 Tax=Gossypium klotzschianum TaxID=34286 RepID=A0A7J8WER4_9ROSI|nr:hypothetical protein [Gossypium klotzschianum]